MNSKTLWMLALLASVAYGLLAALTDLNTVEAVLGALVVAALWVAAARVRRGEVGPRDRSARRERRAGRLDG